MLKIEHPKAFAQLKSNWNFDEEKETLRWRDIVGKIYFAYDPSRDIFLQQDGFLDKDLMPASELPKTKGHSTKIGRGTGFFVPRTSSRPIPCKVYTSLKINMTLKSLKDILISMSH